MRARLAGAVLLAGVAFARNAHAFCRTTTKAIAPTFQASEGECWTEGLPLWWQNQCIGYSLQKAGSRQVPVSEALDALTSAFRTWTDAVACPGGGVSIDIVQQALVSCAKVEYNSDAPNQHVIVFRDDGWTHPDDTVNTLALTTVTYNSDTGEIYDADMEINTHDQLITIGASPRTYDLVSILTHEAGHFLGLAHSPDSRATMYARYVPGRTSMRRLSADDVAGICTIYPPDGTRAVGMAVSSSGKVAQGACDPTPRHGFSTECGSELARSSQSGCSTSPNEGTAGAPAFAWAASLFAVGALARRRSA